MGDFLHRYLRSFLTVYSFQKILQWSALNNFLNKVREGKPRADTGIKSLTIPPPSLTITLNNINNRVQDHKSPIFSLSGFF